MSTVHKKQRKKTRKISFASAICEALDTCLGMDKRVVLIGEGVPDLKGIFGTTLGLQEKYGAQRVFDMPVSENGLTGICVGGAIAGLRPIMVHQRIDFTLLAADQIINNAAKWYYMFGGKVSVPLVIRMIIGRGWGQGAQHSQSLQALYGHIPGLKVVMPTFPCDAKGMLIAAVEDNNPVLFIEHRWLHGITGDVPRTYYTEDLDKAKVAAVGNDLTIVATSYMTIESLRAHQILLKEGITLDIVDLRSIKPLDRETIIQSVEKTGRLLAVDTGYKTLGVASEVIAEVSQYAFSSLRCAPEKITLPDVPTPTSWKAAEAYYPTYLDIVGKALAMLGKPQQMILRVLKENMPYASLRSDVPDMSFSGPF